MVYPYKSFFQYPENELKGVNLQSVTMADVGEALNALIKWCENYMCISYEAVQILNRFNILKLYFSE